MESIIKKYYLFLGAVMFIGLPLILWALGEYPARTVFKESLSLLVILSLFLMFAQFFLSRANSSIIKVYHFKNILKIHKVIGYIFVGVFMLHPFMIVTPRFFEAGILPQDAFWKLITTFETTGQIVGLIAYVLMFILGATSMFRNKLGIKYITWKYLHGFLSILFVIFATWHAIDMGRHSEKAMSIWMILLAVGGSTMLLKTYIRSKEVHHEAK